MAQKFLRKYGVETTVDFSLFETDGVDFKTDAVHVAGDTKIMKNEGAEANTTNGFTDEGQGYSLVISATEMQAARIVVYIADQGTKAWLDDYLVVETYGNASAQHAIDLDDSVRAGLTALPNAAADAAGGLPISDAGGLDLDGLNTNINDIETDTNELQTDWTNGGRLDLILDDILVDTGTTIPADISGLNDISPATVNSEVDTALSDIKLDHLIAVADADDVVDDSIIAKLASKSATADWSTYVNTTDSQEAIRDKQADIEADTQDLQNQVGTAGAGLTDLGGMSTGMKAEVESEANDALVAQKLDHLVAVADADDVVDNAIIAKLASKNATADWSTYVNTTDSLEAIKDQQTDIETDMTTVKDIIIAMPLKKNTAFTDFEFQMFDSITGDPKTLLSVTAERSLDGGAYTTMANAVSEISSGTYKINIAAADINGTTGTWKFTATGAKTTYITFLTYL